MVGFSGLQNFDEYYVARKDQQYPIARLPWCLRAAAVLAVAAMAARQGHAEDLVIPIGGGLEESVDLRGGCLVRLVDGA